MGLRLDTTSGDYEIFRAGDFRLQSGEVLPDARIAFKAAGRLNARGDNAIVYPTSYATRHTDIEWMVGPGRALDTDHYYVVIPNMLGNGLSSSPSNTDAACFPAVSVLDNVVLQHELLFEQLGVRRLALAVGFSMGAQQAYQWAAAYPEKVACLAAICGTARTTRHNVVFLEGVKAALTGDPTWNGEQFVGRAERGLKAMARVYAGWGLSQAFYRHELYKGIGYANPEEFIVNDWERFFGRHDANDLLAMLHTWQRTDISDNPLYGKDLPRALGSIQAKSLIMPSRTDLYFTVPDIEAEASMIPDARMQVIETDWGHRVNNPKQNPRDADFVQDRIRELLAAV